MVSGESPLASQRLAGKWLQWNDDPGFANCCLLSFMLHARSTRLRVERAEQERWQTARSLRCRDRVGHRVSNHVPLVIYAQRDLTLVSAPLVLVLARRH